MIQMNLICRCDHIGCGAERVVRVEVSVAREAQHITPGLQGTFVDNDFVASSSSLTKALDDAGWSYEFAQDTSGNRRERVLCSTHKREHAKR